MGEPREPSGFPDDIAALDRVGFVCAGLRPLVREMASHLKWNSAIAYRLALLTQSSTEASARAGPGGRYRTD